MKDRIVTLATCSYSRAELLKARLQAEGIDCYLINVNLLQSAVAQGVRVRIRGEDLTRALEIIDELELTYAREPMDQKLPKVKVDVNRILVPVDFSDFSSRMCDYALDMAKKFKADILLFHTYFASAVETIPFSDSYTYNATVVEVLSQVEKSAKVRLRELFHELQRKMEEQQIKDVEIDYALGAGTAATEILLMCKRYKPDIMIMGSRGETAGTENLLGSVATKVIEQSPVPVLLVSDQGDYIPLDKVDNIMYATDFDQSDFKSIARLKYLVKPYDMKIHCIHFEKEDEEYPWEEHRMKILQKYFKRTFGDTDITCKVIKMEEIQKGIEDYTHDQNIGIIGMVARKHNLLERVFGGQPSRKLFLSTHIPILIFH